MAYTAINTTDIEAGKPVKEEIFDQIRTNQEHFNSELVGLSGTAKIDMFNIRLEGQLNDYTTSGINSRIPYYKSLQDADPGVIAFVATLVGTSTSGTFTMDLEKSTDNANTWSSILSAPVTLTGTTRGSQSSTPTFTDATFNQNDLFRIVISTIQVGQGSVQISVYGEV